MNCKRVKAFFRNHGRISCAEFWAEGVSGCLLEDYLKKYLTVFFQIGKLKGPWDYLFIFLADFLLTLLTLLALLDFRLELLTILPGLRELSSELSTAVTESSFVFFVFLFLLLELAAQCFGTVPSQPVAFFTKSYTVL